jgi:hypothetical protein
MAENSENNSQKGTPGTEKPEKKVRQPKAAAMVPLLSKRSIFLLSIGLIFGVGLGMAYWAFSPSISSALERLTSGQLGATESRAGPHQSIVSIELTNPGSSYTDLRELRYMGEYYSARANTYSFFAFLSEKLESEEPQYSHTPDELEQMTTIRYDYKAESPAIEIAAVGNSDQEALLLARFIPQVFQEYLIEEENKIQQQEYEDTAKDMKTTRIALLEAEKELAKYPYSQSSKIESDADYLALRSKVVALEIELDNWAGRLAVLVALGQGGTDYAIAKESVQRTSTALASAKQELSALEATAAAQFLPQELEHQRAQVNVDILRGRLSELANRLTLTLGEDADEPDIISYFAVGKPSPAVPVEPERIRGRNAAMMGAVFGMGAVWLTMNRRWLAKQMSSSSEAIEEQDKEKADE